MLRSYVMASALRYVMARSVEASIAIMNHTLRCALRVCYAARDMQDSQAFDVTCAMMSTSYADHTRVKDVILMSVVSIQRCERDMMLKILMRCCCRDARYAILSALLSEREDI